MCRGPLVHSPRDAGDGHVVIGEECHLVSPKPGGPRSAEPIDQGTLDSYENLMLLCPNDHSLIDQAVAEYPLNRLKSIKLAHESWWSNQAVSLPEPVRLRRGAPTPLVRIRNGRELMGTVAGAEESSLDGQPETQEEVGLLAGFIQEINDASEIWDDIEPGSRLQYYFDIDSEIKGLEAEGWGVFASRAKGTISGGTLATPSSWDCAYVRVVRLDSPEIVTVKG
jgi:hypothetical protein